MSLNGSVTWSRVQILALRRHLRLTQPAFAAVVGVDSSTISRWERGISYPQPIYCKRLEELSEKKAEQEAGL